MGVGTAKAYGGKRRKDVTWDPDAWQTPVKLFAELNAEFGFKTDLFADHLNAICDNWLTQEQDAFTFPWHTMPGPGFWNPPYSRVREAIKKARFEWVRNGYQSVGLVKADTSTKWFRENWERIPEIRFLPRIQFIPPPGYTGKVGSPNMGHCLLIFR